MTGALRATILALVGAACLVSCRRAPAPTVAPLPREARTAEECKACGGLWGRHGLAEAESCLCATGDGGKRCRDGKECQGDCLVDEASPEVEVTDPGPPRRGFFVGRCSKYDRTFGCFKVAADGAAAAGPVPLDTPPDTICVD